MMAGGVGGRGVPLHARVIRSAPTPALGCPARHCWVTAPADGGDPRPGLLLEWRKDAHGQWEGRVVYAAELRAGRWSSVEEWVSADLLKDG
jgi:hypothetical protein